MHPKEVQYLVEKYSSSCENELSNISKDIEDISIQIKTINSKLASQLKTLAEGDEIVPDAEVVLEAAKFLNGKRLLKNGSKIIIILENMKLVIFTKLWLIN